MRLVIFLRIGDTDVFVCCLDELLSELLFELGGSAVDVDVLEILVQLELVELFLLELLEGLLDGDLGRQFVELMIFFITRLHLKLTIISLTICL